MAINVKDKLVTLESLGVAYSAEQEAREDADQALSTRIDNIVAPEGDPSLTEVSDARVSGSTTHNTLKARLDADKAAVETEISQLSADLDSLDESLGDITFKHEVENYFDFTQEAIVERGVEDLTVTYSENNDINLSFTSTANPKVCFKFDDLIGGKKYTLSLKVASGSITESHCYVRKYNAPNPHSGVSLGTVVFVSHVGTVDFTVPSGETSAVLQVELKYNSKNVTLSDVSVTAYGDAPATYLRSSLLTENVVEASFIYNTNTGDCTILKINGDTENKVVMIDCMPNEQTAKTNISSALSRSGISHIDYFILSHWHSDHCGCLQYLYDNGYIDDDTIFYLPEDPDEESEGLTREDNADKYVVALSQAWLATIAGWNCTVVYPTEDEILEVNGYRFKFWNVDHSAYYARAWVDYNECSLCCTMTYGNTVAHFTGDIGPVACGKYYDKLAKCNIFKANHHACGYAVVNRFMSAVCPDIVVTMAGSNVIYSTNANVQAVFATLNNGLQQWCEDEFVPNFVTGVIQANVYMTIGKNAYRFDSISRRCIRADESIPASS